MKVLILITVCLMILGLFAINLVVAEEVQKVDSIEAVVSEAPDFEESEVAEIVTENEEIAPTETKKVRGLKRATLGRGWAVKSDDSAAEYLRASWVGGFVAEVPLSEMKRIREEYKGDREKIAEELRKLKTEKTWVSTGRLHVGLGRLIENFKLMKKEITGEKAVFYVLPISANLKELDETSLHSRSVGTLELDKKKYPHLTLWSGSLSLSSGEYSGDWKVSISSATKNFNKPIVASKVAGKIRKAGEAQDGSEETDRTKPKKVGFWKRLMFWRRNK